MECGSRKNHAVFKTLFNAVQTLRKILRQSRRILLGIISGQLMLSGF